MGARRGFPDDKSWKRRRERAGRGKERRMMSVVTTVQAQDELRVDLDAIVGEGARRMLAAALEAEVDAYLAACADQRDEQGRRLVVRNGHARQRQVVTAAAGAVRVRAPRVDDRPGRSGDRWAGAVPVILPPWCRRSPKVAEVGQEQHPEWDWPFMATVLWIQRSQMQEEPERLPAWRRWLRWLVDGGQG
jgi:Transposase, Mutator family